MVKKSTNTEETKQSTVVLNDEVNPIQDPVEDTPTPIDTGDTGDNCPPTGDCSDPNHVCTCKPGHCPNKDCKSGHYWTEGTKDDQYLYHYDSEDESIKLEDANHRKANPKYEAPKDPEPPKTDPVVPNPDQTPDAPSNDCGDEMNEPWAHDELLQDLDGRTGLERELRWHCGVTYDVVEMWLDELRSAVDKEAVIAKIAWHIPTGGPKSIKVHHKAKIVEALRALK
nr:MAG TPA: hypothetical protein [Ackermannviridae sp.]